MTTENALKRCAKHECFYPISKECPACALEKSFYITSCRVVDEPIPITFNLKNTPVEKGSVKIESMRRLVLRDDGNSNLLWEHTGERAGTIIYYDGECSLDIEPLLRASYTRDDSRIPPHKPEDCAYHKLGICPECGTRWYIEDGDLKHSYVDPDKFGLHDYPAKPHRTSNCTYGCGCWAGPVRSGGPVDPFGPCPRNPIAKKNEKK